MKKIFTVTIFLLILSVGSAFALSGHKGTVVTTMNVEGYTYMELENNGGKFWIACPNVEVKVGDAVETSAGMLMTDFYSKTLKRTFKEIHFVTYVEVVKKEPSNSNKNVKPLEITLTELYNNKENYNGKLIKIMGIITKASPNIMGKNWYHIGEKDKKFDVVVSSKDSSNLNDSVFVEGVVTLNKNIGGGYNFPIFIEDGKVTLK